MIGETIFCVANRMWDSLWRDSQQIMSRLAQKNRVFYFEPGRNPDRKHSAELFANAPYFLQLDARQIDENLIVVPTPSCLPYMRRQIPSAIQNTTVPLVARVNAAISRVQI